MATPTVTFDFHNTIADCPDWFDLEVRRLPSAFLEWWQFASNSILAEPSRSVADARYRELRQAIIEHGNELTAEECLGTVFSEMGLAVPTDALEQGVAMLMQQTLFSTSPVPGAIETITALHGNGVQLGIVSSAVYHPFLEWTLEAFGIRKMFSAVVTSASAGFYKSRPELYYQAAQLLGAEPARIVHVGDSLRFDVGGASRAGMGTVWLRPANAKHVDDSIVPDLTIDTLRESAAPIQRLLAARANGVVADVHGTG